MSAREIALGRLAASLLRDLDEVDQLTTDRFAAEQQKLSLIVEAFSQAVDIAERSAPVEFINPVPASLAGNRGP